MKTKDEQLQEIKELVEQGIPYVIANEMIRLNLTKEKALDHLIFYCRLNLLDL